MHAEDLIAKVNNTVQEYIDGAVKVEAETLGLDKRCYGLYVAEGAIIVSKNNDRTLQYYGGFEYVDKEYRCEIGDYVFYLADRGCTRVADCIERYMVSKEE